MSETENLSRSLHRYTGVVRRQWWVTLIVVVVALGAAALYVARATPVYSASSKVFVGQGQTLFTPGVSVDYVALTSTISSLLQSNVVAEGAIKDLGLHTTPTALLNNLNVTAQPDGAVLTVSYNDTNRNRAVRVLSEIGSVFTTLVNTRLTSHPAAPPTTAQPQTSQPVSAAVFDPAHADPGQVSPHRTRAVAIAIVLGLVGGIVLAFLRDAFSSSIKSEEDAAQAYAATSIGTVPKGALGVGIFSVAALPRAKRARMSEAFQMVVTRLRYSTSLQRGVIVVIGARPEDGKSTIAAHIAAGLAVGDSDVVAVEADLHRPALHRLLGVSPDQPGISDLGLHGGALSSSLVTIDRDLVEGVPQRAPQPVPDDGETELSPSREAGNGYDFEMTPNDGRLRLLPAGVGSHRATGALSLENVSSLIMRLRALADYVVVDTPPLLMTGDAYPLIQMADAVVVVCRRGATRHHEAAKAREILHSLGVTEYSLVVTDADPTGRTYYGYGHA